MYINDDIKLDNIFTKMWNLYNGLRSDKNVWHKFINYGDRDNTHFDIDVSVKLYNMYKLPFRYPNGSKYIVVATHDVDNIYPSLGIIKYYIKKNPFYSARLLLGRIFGNMRYFLNLEDIISKEYNYNFSSTFYLLVSDRDILPLYRSYYKDDEVRKEIKAISNKAEIGLHTGYYSYNSKKAILEEKTRIENIIGHKIYGVRNHYLNMDPPKTWHMQANAGFIYDTTLGYNRGFGYKNKICYPFTPYDQLLDSWINIIELPLTIMDRGIINTRLDPELFIEKYREFIEKYASKYGCFITLLWHNDLLVDPRFKRYAKLYWKIIEYTRETEGYITNAIDAVRIWVKNIIEYI